MTDLLCAWQRRGLKRGRTRSRPARGVQRRAQPAPPRASSAAACCSAPRAGPRRRRGRLAGGDAGLVLLQAGGRLRPRALAEAGAGRRAEGGRVPPSRAEPGAAALRRQGPPAPPPPCDGKQLDAASPRPLPLPARAGGHGERRRARPQPAAAAPLSPSRPPWRRLPQAPGRRRQKVSAGGRRGGPCRAGGCGLPPL